LNDNPASSPADDFIALYFDDSSDCSFSLADVDPSFPCCETHFHEEVFALDRAIV
jgi:hypothetical protein